MLLWIVRHGKAEPTAPSGKDDDRPLASRGRRQAEWLGKQIAGRKDKPARIISSPVLRAIDTANLLNAGLRLPLDTSTALVVGRPASAALGLVEEAEDGPLMLVGHNPQLEKLLALLTRGAGAEAEMKTGQAVLLDVDLDNAPGKSEAVETLRLDV